MSRSNRHAPIEKFHFPAAAKHWHGADLTRSLGCQKCFFHGVCGGLQVEASVFDCMTYCRCTDKSTCDNVCPRNAEHQVARMHEVRGIELSNVPASVPVASPDLPLLVPMIYHGYSRSRPLQAKTIALSLYQMFDKMRGSVRFQNRRALLEHFQIADDTTIILSGTQEDFLIERWWNLANREEVTRHLIHLGISMITTPNYSLFGDVPRLDNLFNMKRIALVWSEIQREGMPCAIHLNARTDRDFQRWTEFLRDHTEITHVAFEFGTGAGSPNRIDWHMIHLGNLARQVARPLHLIVRGGTGELRTLRNTFAGITLIDTSAFLKAHRRQRLLLTGNGLKSAPAPTEKGMPLDDLLDANIAASLASVERTTTQ
jgi:hypothetical protein